MFDFLPSLHHHLCLKACLSQLSVTSEKYLATILVTGLQGFYDISQEDSYEFAIIKATGGAPSKI
jgi:hypothetical protein